MWYRKCLANIEAVEDWYEQADQVFDQTYQNFKQNPQQRQEWHTVPAARLTKIWTDYSKNGFVRDVKGLEYIAQIMMENTQKLYANTLLAGHTEHSPEDYVQERLEGSWTEEDDYQFADHILDENNAWRISDYALRPLMEDSLQLMTANSPEQKLLIIDRMLNRIHARSDIAGLYVEGGTSTLNALAQ